MAIRQSSAHIAERNADPRADLKMRLGDAAPYPGTGVSRSLNALKMQHLRMRAMFRHGGAASMFCDSLDTPYAHWPANPLRLRPDFSVLTLCGHTRSLAQISLHISSYRSGMSAVRRSLDARNWNVAFLEAAQGQLMAHQGPRLVQATRSGKADFAKVSEGWEADLGLLSEVDLSDAINGGLLG